MNLVERAKNVILTPKTEWDKIAPETTPPQELVLTYVLPLAAAAAIASFIGTTLLMGMIGSALGAKIGFGMGIVGAIIHIVMAVVSCFVIAFIIDALAPTFGGQKSFQQALKLAVYAYTPGWVFGILAIIPFLGWLAALIGGLYGIYILYLGLPKLMKNPEEKSVGYLVVIILCAIVLWMVIAFITSMVMGMGMIGAGMMSSRASPTITYDKDSRLGQLQEFGKKMEEQGKRMEAASKSGDANKQMEEAMKTLGVAMSGGKGVEPVSIDELKPLVPDKLAGLPRSDVRTEKSGVQGMMVSKAEATYTEGDKRVNLEIVDTGGMAGLMGMAAWMGVQGEREDSSHRESTRRDGDNMVHESVSKTGGSNEYTMIVGNRFVVSAKGNADIGTLKSAVGSIDLSKLATKKG